MLKQKIVIEVENPEALNIASERLTKAIVDVWWKKNVDREGGSKLDNREKIWV